MITNNDNNNTNMYEPMDLGHHGAPYCPTHPNILRRAKLCPAQAASNYVGGHHSDERRFDGSLLELDMTRVSQLNPPELHLDIDVFLGIRIMNTSIISLSPLWI